MAFRTSSKSNELLGYPADARLLIINADDFGLCDAITDAIHRSITRGIVRSTTVMMPCAGAQHALDLLKQQPEMAFGVHLTVICDTLNPTFGPLTPSEQVPSLVNEAGIFYDFDGMSELLAKAQIDELETEFRAQIEAVLDSQLKPTHLDWHCLRFGHRNDIYDLMLNLAKEYGLALRVIGQKMTEKVQAQGLPCNDYDFLDSFSIDVANKFASYARLLRELPAGLSEWAVHPGFGNAELAALQPTGLPIRQSDLDALTSPAMQEIIKEEGIILLDYRSLQAVWNEA